MKKGFIITAALALTLGVGVAVGAQSNPVKGVDAAMSGTIIYLDVSGGDWFADDDKVAIWNHGGSCFDQFQYDSDQDIYKTYLTATTTSFNLFRGSSLSWGDIHNQSDDASFEDGKNLIVSDGYDSGKMIFHWDVFTVKSNPSSEKNSFYVHDPSGYLGDFEDVNVYGFGQASNIKAMKWPGKHDDVTETTLGLTEMYSVELSTSYPKFIINGAESHQTADIEDLADHLGDVLVIANDCSTQWKATSEYTDYPAENGYYLVGSETEWSFSGAPKLTECTGGEATYYKAKIVYDVANEEEFKIKQYNSGVTTWYGYEGSGGNNYVSGSAGRIAIYLKQSGTFEVDTDFPEENGYYIQYTGHWNYAGAVKMNNTTGTNVAEYLEFDSAVNMEARVCSYYTDRAERHQWSTVTNSTEPSEIGLKDGNNFKFTAAREDCRVYAYYDEHDVFSCNFAAPLAHYDISITAVLFNGGSKDTTQDQTAQTAYEEVVFNPYQEDMSGYVKRGFFTDANCTDAYVAHAFTGNGQLYAKYTKVGFYTIYGASDYSIDSATLMQTEGIAGGNKAETSLTVAVANSCYSFVYYNGEMSGQDGLGQEYGYAVYEDSHVKFTKTGTYAIYWSDGDNLIYLNEGLTAFYTTFISVTEEACSESTPEARIAALKLVWAGQASAYGDLKPGEKSEVEAIGFNGGDKDSEDLGKRFMARYARIITNYGTSNFNDFIFNVSRPASNGSILSTNQMTSTSIIIIAVLSVSAVSICLLVVFKKKRKE